MTVSDIYIFRIWLSSLLFFFFVSRTKSQTSYTRFHSNLVHLLMHFFVVVFRAKVFLSLANVVGKDGVTKLHPEYLTSQHYSDSWWLKATTAAFNNAGLWTSSLGTLLPDVRDPGFTGLTDWLGTTVFSSIIHKTVSSASLINYCKPCKKTRPCII